MPNLLTKKTVSGTRLTYDVQMVDADGSKWLQIIESNQVDPSLRTVSIHEDDLRSLLEAIRDVGGELAPTLVRRKERRLSLESPLLRDRKARKRWDNGEEALLLGLWNQGFRPDEIMILLGRTFQSITSRLEQLGIYPNWAQGEDADWVDPI
jgi:hypothetical protein